MTAQERKMRGKAWFAKMAELQKIPGNCTRCGKPNSEASKFKTCPKCRDATLKAHERGRVARDDRARLWNAIAEMRREMILLRGERAEREAITKHLGTLSRRIDSHDLAIARAEVSTRRNFARSYQKGYKAGTMAALKKECDESFLSRLPTITKQELATMNHAYDHDQG